MNVKCKNYKEIQAILFNYHFKRTPITFTSRRATRQAKNSNSKPLQLWSIISIHLPPLSWMHLCPSFLCILRTKKRPYIKVKVCKLRTYLGPSAASLTNLDITENNPFLMLPLKLGPK